MLLAVMALTYLLDTSGFSKLALPISIWVCIDVWHNYTYLFEVMQTIHILLLTPSYVLEVSQLQLTENGWQKGRK